MWRQKGGALGWQEKEWRKPRDLFIEFEIGEVPDDGKEKRVDYFTTDCLPRSEGCS